MNEKDTYELNNVLEKSRELHINRSFLEAQEGYKKAIKLAYAYYDDDKTNNRDKEPLNKLIKRIYDNYLKCQGPNFDNVVGLDDLKELFTKGIFAIVRNKELANEYGVKANLAILLTGAPGTGKSYGIKAAINEFPEAMLIEEKCTNLVNSLIGETGKNIDALFEKANDYLNQDENNYVIIFIDEIDAIARSRVLDDKASKEAMGSLLVNLTKIDEENKNIIFVGATNTPDQLDPAFVSRFGNNVIEIKLPSSENRKKILEMNLPYEELSDEQWEQIENMTEGLSGRDLKFIANDANRYAFNEAINGIKKPVDFEVLSKIIELANERRRSIKRSGI